MGFKIGSVSALLAALAAAFTVGAGTRWQASPAPARHAAAAGDSQSAGVVIRQRERVPTVDLGLVDPHGAPLRAACSTCHATRPPAKQTRAPEELDEFHQGLHYSHGRLTCLSCHNTADYDTLKLADGTRVPFQDAMTLCAQCHGPQTRDYQHGSHGGGIGYWDLSRGTRVRNNCLDCHDAHAPQIPKMKPTFKPRDRFLAPENADAHGPGQETHR